MHFWTRNAAARGARTSGREKKRRDIRCATFHARPADGGLQIVANANDNEIAEVLLDLFRVYFLGRLLA